MDLKILAVDIGTGTQDIFLFDSRFALENGFKMVMPSATMLIHQKIKQATKAGRPILLTGEIMGGGPSAWAAEAHLKAGFPVLATPNAARSFNDDLELVQAMGIKIINEDESLKLSDDLLRIEMKDFDFPLIKRTMNDFGIDLSDLDALAIAVFDHGNAPKDVSDRKYRFDYLASRIKTENRLSAFAYNGRSIPGDLTRMQAVANTCVDLPFQLVLMDTAPAAILGATLDPLVARRDRKLIINIGNFHSLAFRLGFGGIEGVFEHHTGFLDCKKLESILARFVDGSLNNEWIFNDHGHGAWINSPEEFPLKDPEFNIVVTGPRRNMLQGSSYKPYFAVPFGDMMLSGCFGLLTAVGEIFPEYSAEITRSLQGQKSGTAPWEID